MRAISILDTALWDLNARTAELPLPVSRLVRRRSGARLCERRLLPRRQNARTARPRARGLCRSGLQSGEDESRPAFTGGRRSARPRGARSAYGRWYHKELLDKRGAEILQTDALVCGGITEWKRIAALAAGYGVTMCPHWFRDVHAHLVTATPNARYVEFFIDDQMLNFRRLIDTQLQYKDGDLLLPQTPGLGFDFDQPAVKRYALDQAKVWTVIRI